MKIKNKICSISAIVLAAILSCNIAGASDEPTVEEFVAAFSAANDTRKQAGAMGHEWRDTAKILRKAKETAEAGDLVTAMSLVEEAQMQAEQGVIQATREQALWISRVIR